MKTTLSRSLSTLFSLLVLAPFASAQNEESQHPEPGPEHKHLAKAEGNWNATIEMMDMEPSKGTSQMKMVLGGFWLEDRFTAEFQGMPFEGRGLTGYDPIKRKYVGVWTDSVSPMMMVSEGTFDEKTRTLTMVGDGYDHMGAKVKVRMLTIHKDADHVVFEMYHTGADAKEQKVMTIHYERAGAAPATPGK